MAKLFKRKEDIIHRKIAGESILVPIRGELADMSNIFFMNTVGEFIWEFLDGNMHLDDIINAIIDDFDVSRNKADTDANEFITDLQKAGLIEKVI
jgi:hypothetical protein